MVIMSSRDVYAEDVKDSEVESGEELESDPPFRVGEERRIEKYGITKKFLCAGVGWENPRYGDEVTVHYVGSLLDGSEFVSSRRDQEPLTFKLRNGEIVTGLMHGIHTMEKGEKALFTLPPDLAYGADGANGVPPNSTVLFEVELLSWLTVVDVCKDGGIEKKVISVGLLGEQPGNLDQVTVKFEAKLLDGRIINNTPDEGVEFYLNDGYFCPALPKALMTMNKEEKALLIVQPHYGFGEEGRVACDGFSTVPPNSTLVICVELVSLKPVLHVTGDLNVVKKILEEGKGLNYPEDGSVVHVRYTGMLEDGTMFESKGADAPFTFVLHEENVTEGLDKAVATMRKGEKAVLTVKPDFGYGDSEVQADLAKVPASSTLTYNVELIDFTTINLEKEPYEMSEVEKVKFAERKKEEGNTLYKAEKYLRALKRYEKAGEYVYKEYGFRDYKKESNSLRISILLNKAACTLKLNDFKATIRHCSMVLDEESHNVKALYRRAQAYIQTSDLDSADRDVKLALEIDPHDKDVQKTQQVLKQQIMVMNKMEVQLYSNMLSKLSGDTDQRPAKRMRTGDDSERIVERAEVVNPNQPQEAGQV